MSKTPRHRTTPAAVPEFGPINGIGLAAAIDQAGHAVVITDPVGNITYVNSAFTQLTGYSEAEAIGQNPRVLKSFEQDPAFYKDLWETIRAGQTWHGDLINRRKDGSHYTEEMTISPVLDSEGEVSGYVAIKRDVTDERESEAARRLLAAMVESSADAIIGTSPEHKILSWNQGAEALLGYRAEEVIGKPISILLPPDLLDEGVRVREQIEKGEILRADTVVLTKDGCSIDISATVSPVRDDTGKVVGAVGINRDIRERVRAERATRDSAERFRALFERSMDVLYIHDFEGNVLDVNESALRLLGYEREELTSMNVSSLLERDAMPGLMEGLKEFERTGVSEKPIELKLRCKNGAFVEVETRLTIIPFKITRAVLGVARDVTERKRAEEVLRESEARFRTMADSCPTLMWVTGTTGEIQFVNRTYREFFDVSLEQLVSGKWQALIHPADAADYIGAFQRSVQGRKGFEAEARVRRSDGEWRWLASYAEPRWSPSGEWLGHIGLSLDITKRKQAEESLRESEEKFRQLAENVREAFWIAEADGSKVLYVSPAYENIWGHSCEELYRDPLAWSKAIDPEEQERVREVFRKKVPGEVIESEYKIRTPAGEMKWVRDRAFPVLNQAGEIVRLAGIAEDITERKLIEAEMLRAKEAAEAANRAKSQFLANMSHEIRTPMNGVIGITELLLDTELTTAQRQYADMVRSSGESLMRVINDILDFSKIEANKLELAHLDFDLRDTIEDVAKLLGVKANQKGLKLMCLIDPEVPSRLRGDSGRLQQILLNLAGNAVKFTDRGSVTIRARLDRQDRRSAALHFSVEDTGIGIHPDRQADIFSPFTQVDGSATRKYGGTGLGLAISRQLAELLGGQMGVESNPGEGSTFWFTARFEKQPDESRLLAEAWPASTPMLEFPQGPTPRVLVVEDDLCSQQVALGILAKLGCQADVAASGKEALASLRRTPYDLVLMDCQMPDMDGLETAVRIRHARSGVRNPEIPIVALTAHAQESDRQECLAAGMNDFVTKPVHHKTLAAVLRKWLPHAEARSAAVPLDSAPGDAPITPSSTPLVFDEADLRERLDENDDLVRKVVSSFLEDMPRQLAALRSHLDAGNATAAVRQAHTIKGAAAAVGGNQMQDVAFEMEQAGKAGDLHLVSARFKDLEQQFQLTKEAMGSVNGCVPAQRNGLNYENADRRR